MMIISKFNQVGSEDMPRGWLVDVQKGFSLVELMIALVISLVLLLVIGTVFVSSNQAFRVQEDNARIQEGGRFALEIIGRSIKQAGYVDVAFTGPKVEFTGIPINGIDGAAGAADAITVQYEGVGLSDCQGNGSAAADEIIQSHFNLDVANAELQCLGEIADAPAVPGAAAAGDVLLDNVEDLQIMYGLDTTGDASANQYVAAPADWEQVVTTRVCVLIRSEKTNIVNVGNRYLNCLGATVTTPADRRLRRAFTATFNLRNRIHESPWN